MSQDDLPDSLRGRILAYTGYEQADLAARHTAQHPASGLVLSTKAPGKLIRPIHGQYRPNSLLCDVRAWSSTATVTEPSAIPAEENRDRWARGLINLGASAVLTPSKFVPAAAWDLLAAVVDETHRFTHDNVVSFIATDAAMLDEAHFAHFRAAVARARRPLAFRFAASGRPFEKRGRARALRALLSDFPGSAIIGVEVLTATDAMAHGAGMTAIGVTSTYRWPSRPGDSGGPRSSDKAPGVFLRDLWETRSPTVYADWHANSRSPWCETCQCAIDTFGPGDRDTIFQHTLHSWLDVWEDLAPLPLAEMARQLRDELREAFLRHREFTGTGMTADRLLCRLVELDDPYGRTAQTDGQWR